MSISILIVDDSRLVRRQVGDALRGGGFVVVEASDGADALDKLAQTPGIALVVSDVNMPRMNGLELLENVRADPNVSGIPFLMLTTEGQPELIQRARGLGARAWLVKPFKADLLVLTVAKLTSKAA